MLTFFRFQHKNHQLKKRNCSHRKLTDQFTITRNGTIINIIVFLDKNIQNYFIEVNFHHWDNRESSHTSCLTDVQSCISFLISVELSEASQWLVAGLHIASTSQNKLKKMGANTTTSLLGNIPNYKK